MPAQQNETLNVVDVVELALEIFNEDFISFHSEEEVIKTKIDRSQLIRIITNLVKNAIQAIPSNVENKYVKVSIERVDESVHIKVEDNGVGIATANYRHIFEPKFTTKSSGMGLGLGIIKNIIENYKGTITFESEVNQGTVFTVSLPIIKN